MTFAGLGIGASDGSLGIAAPALGVLAAAAVSLLFWGINVRGSGTVALYATASGRVVIDPDDAMFAVPLLLWGAGPDTVLLLAGTLAPAAAAMVLRMAIHGARRRQPGQQSTARMGGCSSR